MSLVTLPFLVILFVHQSYSLNDGYYWREYTGVVPSDALVAGTDINKNNVYIGQAYVKNEGIVVVQLAAGVTETYATIGGSKKVDKYIKILCGAKLNFKWMPANATDFHLLMINKHPVVGGHEDTYGQMNIGRIAFEGGVKVGKVNGFWPGDVLFYFNDKGTEKSVKYYEVLLYEELQLDVRSN